MPVDSLALIHRWSEPERQIDALMELQPALIFVWRDGVAGIAENGPLAERWRELSDFKWAACSAAVARHGELSLLPGVEVEGLGTLAMALQTHRVVNFT